MVYDHYIHDNHVVGDLVEVGELYNHAPTNKRAGGRGPHTTNLEALRASLV